MSENNRPAASPTKIDLAKVARNQKVVKGSRTPMASDRLYNMGNVEDTTGRIQLISPPPEETLHFRRTSSGNRSTPVTSKRKRNMPPAAEPTVEPPQPLEATPNPKPRKQSKHRPVLVDSPTRPAPTTPSKLNRVLLTKSPHAENPDADFILPVLSSTSRRARRTTPIPAYEPPSDVFTPPRIVMLTPTISKSSKRKSTTKPKPKEPLKIIVKREPPQIDLSLPMPPPSPTDDPLLLSGPIEPPTSTPVRPPRQLREIGVSTVQDPLPPSSSPADEHEPGVPRFDWTHHPEPEDSTDFSMDIDAAEPGVPPVALFDFNLPGSSEVDGGWSDSDDDGAPEEEVGEGEYTGRFRTVRVRTKLDPPSSATRERMEEWGRPITPFPRKKISRLDLLQEVEGEDEQGNQDVEMEEDEQDEEEQEVREMSVSLDEEEEEEQSVELEQEQLSAEKPNLHFDFDASFDTTHIQDAPEEALVDMDPPVAQNDASELMKDASVLSSDDQDNREDDPEQSLNHDIEQSFNHDPEEDDAEEEREVREMSVVEDDDVLDHTSTSAHRSAASIPAPIIAHHTHTHTVPFPPLQPAEEEATTGPVLEEREQEVMVPEPDEEAEEAPVVAVDDDISDAESSDADVDFGVVKISSADPRAAARAAAILKQHDYDCFTKITMKQRLQQRKRHSVAEGGITKARGDSKKRRRTTLGASVVGDRVYIPGSPVVTLPELLREAEAEVIAETPRTKAKAKGAAPLARNPFETPARAAHMVTPQVVLGERAWTKEEWKLLDACFTDERLEVGGVGVLGMAPVDLVRAESVVKRFVEMLGGEEVVETFGDAWDMDNLLQRVKALQNKQRSGNVAPPTTPYTPSPSALNTFTHSRRIPSMEVPDFTPLGRRAPPPARAQRPVLPPPVLLNAPFSNLPLSHKEPERPKRKLPASLLAPRYSHLLEEAVAVSQLSTHVADSSVAAADTDAPDDASPAPSPAEEVPDYSPASPPLAPSLPPAPATIGKRVKGFLFSYLPTLSKTAPAGSKKAGHHLPRQPGLPLPPLDVLEKPRGPIATPVRAPVPRPAHPKELVNLQPAPAPLKPTMIPRAKKPQRMVELHHVSPPPEKEREVVVVPRPRRSSGGSVKDLVKGFEQLDSRRGEGGRKGELKRVRSIGDWRKTAGLAGGAGGSGKPGWRP